MIPRSNDFYILFAKFLFYILSHSKGISRADINRALDDVLNSIFELFNHIYYHILLLSKGIFDHELTGLYKLLMLNIHYFNNELFEKCSYSCAILLLFFLT